MRKDIKNISLSSVMSALIVVLLMTGTFIEIIDITTAAICTLAVFIIQIEAKTKYALLVYFTSSALSLIFIPLSSATLYFVGFFGFYPILRHALKTIKKILRKLLCLMIFNINMCALFFLLKAVFALQNEPFELYVALIITANIFFICFDYLLDIFTFFYIKKIRPKFTKR